MIFITTICQVRVLRTILKHVPPFWNMFQIGIVCHSEKCAILKHASDWHWANFIISQPHVKCKDLKYKNLCKETNNKAKVLHLFVNYRLITAYLLLRVNLDKIMHARWDFDASSARTRRVSALDKHQNWSASALFCLNSRAQSKCAVVNLIHTRRKQTFLSFIMWWIRHFSKFNSHLNTTNKI